MAKKLNTFISNIWNKSKDKIVNAVEVAGNFAGGFVGLGNAGTALSGILDKIPVKKMAEKALTQGVVKTEKVAETLVSAGIPATQENIVAVTGVVKDVSDSMAADKTNGLPDKKATVDKSALTTETKIMTMLKKYWYIPVLILVAGFFLLKPKKNNRKTRR